MRSGSGRLTSRIVARIFARRSAGVSLVCSRNTSSICAPQLITGLSAVIGSWKIIDMRVARSSRRRDSGAWVMSSPWSRICPPLTGSEFGNSPITPCAMTDLPEPDSPTRQTISPRLTLNDTWRTAVARSLPCGSAIVRSRTSRIGALREAASVIRAWPSSDRAYRASRRRGC